MTALLIGAAAVFFVLLSLQGIWAWRFAAMYRHRHIDPTFQGDWPKAVVLLSLRGADPFLPDCIRGLLNQRYDNYDVRIIIDSREDPAWDVVQDLVLEYGDESSVSVSVIEQRYETCGLRLSAFIQEIDALDDSYDVVAYLDADVIPYENWLQDLVAPLADPEIGATTGVRFYQASENNWGTLVRYLWNLAALLQMQAFHIAWGGSLALRASVFRESDLLSKWSRIVFEDTYTFDALRALGLKLKFVPAVTMPNRERIPLDSCYSYIRRQMLNPKLYHSRWPAILTFGLASSAAFAVTQALTITGIIQGDWWLAGLSAAAFGIYGIGVSLAGLVQSNCMHSVIEARGEPRVTPSIKCAAAGPLLQVMYVWCLISVLCLRRIHWRGITYEIRGPMEIQIQNYSPYRPATIAADVSIT